MCVSNYFRIDLFYIYIFSSRLVLLISANVTEIEHSFFGQYRLSENRLETVLFFFFSAWLVKTQAAPPFTHLLRSNSTVS